MRSPVPVRLALCLSVFALAACSDSDPVMNDPPPPDDPGPHYSTAQEAVTGWATALSAQKYDDLGQLLDADFVFYPQSTDLTEFPWMTGDGWSRADELGMLGNMMNDDFVSPVNGNSVDTIAAQLEIQSTQDVEGGTLVRAHAVFTVLWAEHSGAISDVRLEMLMAPGADGYYRMKSQRELPLILEVRTEPASWGSIKSLYRAEPVALAGTPSGTP